MGWVGLRGAKTLNGILPHIGEVFGERNTMLQSLHFLNCPEATAGEVKRGVQLSDSIANGMKSTCTINNIHTLSMRTLSVIA